MKWSSQRTSLNAVISTGVEPVLYDGHILTAGHGFKFSKLNKHFNVHFGGCDVYKAKLIEKGFDTPDECIDFAVLRIENTDINIEPLRISSWRKYINNRGFIHGYASFKNGFGLSIDGYIRDRIVPSNVKSSCKNLVQFDLDNELDARGLSGATVCPNSSPIAVIGVQTQQFNTPYKSDTLFTPCTKIKEVSKIVAKEYYRSEQDGLGAFVCDLLKKRVGKHQIRCKRYCLLISPCKNENNIEIFDLFNSQKYKLFKNIGRFHQDIKVSSKRALLELDFEEINDDDNHKNPLRYYINNIESPAEEIRIIIDFPNSLKNGFKSDLSKKASHTVCVNFGGGDSLLDYTYTLEARDAESAVDAAFNVILDIYADLYLFNNTLLVNYFVTNQEKRSFSKIKVRFVTKYRLLVYGKALYPPESKYVSLASCSRPSATAAINWSYYFDLWYEFLSELFSPNNWLTEPGELIYPTPLKPQVIQAVLTILKSEKSFAGQVNLNKVEQKLHAFEMTPNQHGYLVFAHSRPSSKYQRQNLANLFGRARYKRNMYRVFRSNHRSQLEDFKDYIKIFPFKQGG